MIRRSLLAISALALFANLLSAQDAIGEKSKPNFSGSWKMNAAKSDFGPMPGPDKLDRVIDHKEPTVQSKTTQTGPQGEVTTEIKYKTDGSDSVNTMRGQEVKSVAKWEGDKLVVKSKREVQGMEIAMTETWSLSDAGKVLTVNNSIETPQGNFEIKVVMDKQ